MNRLEEIETVAAHSVEPNLVLNDMEATFFNPFLRYYFNYNYLLRVCLFRNYSK